MPIQPSETIAAEMQLDITRVEAAVALLREGNTIPFIARYRKEVTGSLDEVAVITIRDRLEQIEQLEARKTAVLKSLEAHGHLDEELREKITAAPTLTVVEDLYLPYRPKRRTKATVAREKGLEPLATRILAQQGDNPQTLAAAFVDPEKGVETAADALEGARHIIAEWINEDAEAREAMRRLYREQAVIESRVATGAESRGAKFRDYFDWREPAAKAPSHRILALRRGEKEDILNVRIAPPEDRALALLEGRFVCGAGPDSGQVRQAVQDGYKRLLSRSMETEIRLQLKERADAEAIAVFAGNLRELLMAPPLGPKRMMAIDPGFRTGCKVVCLDRQGKLLHHETVYAHRNEDGDRRAAEILAELGRRFDIEAVAVGNGTAGRETLALVRRIDALADRPAVLVDESGASVYSASEVARREFPDLDLTVRGSVSIGRRLMDPLSELVKIDPKSIGVGQYQHDVDPAALKQALDDTVISCVNAVGVDLNRASVELLTYVSGLGPQLAANIVAYRNEHGAFQNRRQLMEVSRLGPKAFEQAAGFLRIPDSENPLDASAVHPESYPLVQAMARDLACSIADLMTDAALRNRIDLNRYVTETVGLPTLQDILAELGKPGRDPRQAFEQFEYAPGIKEIADLSPGMQLPGVVTNVTAFGAFVDVGVHQDGLVHISELADRFVKDPADVVRVRQKVRVRVLAVDLERNRISLSMRMQSPAPRQTDGKTAERKKPPRPPAGKSPQRCDKKPKPFHNPFAEALGSKKQK